LRDGIALLESIPKLKQMLAPRHEGRRAGQEG
jgi:hypothetical protein